MVRQVFQLLETHGLAHFFVRWGRFVNLRTFGDVSEFLDFGVYHLDVVRDLLLLLRRVPVFVLLFLECLGGEEMGSTLFHFFDFVFVVFEVLERLFMGFMLLRDFPFADIR